jgi:hypothetical protein
MTMSFFALSCPECGSLFVWDEDLGRFHQKTGDEACGTASTRTDETRIRLLEHDRESRPLVTGGADRRDESEVGGTRISGYHRDADDVHRRR